MEWLLHLPAVWMGLIIFGTAYLIAAVVFFCATRLTSDRSRLVDPGILSPLGVVFGLLIVFTAAQVWGDLERANSAVAEEASALRNVVKALDARRQHIVISQTTVSRVRWFGLLVTGLCVMIGIAFAHLDNRRNCRVALALFATGMAASIFIIAAHSRPFNSTVSPHLLDEIRAQYFTF
jgi:hypothetical protein